MKKWCSLALVAVLLVSVLDAEAARRMGGGQSMGRQSSNVTQRQASTPPQQQTTPSQQAQPAAPNAAPNAAPASQANAGRPAAAPAPAKKPWAGILGGLAAGLGLAWLANSLGLGEAFGNILLMGLLAMVVMVVIGMIMRRRSQQYAGAGAGASPFSQASSPITPKSYSPLNVGNDASARPWEQGAAVEPSTPSPARFGSGGSIIGADLGQPASGNSASGTWGIPAGFDAHGFVEIAKRNFVTLQAAWDRADIPTLRSMMTDDMLGEIRTQLAGREAAGQNAQNHSATEVVMLEAQLLGIEDLGHEYMASVEFSGLMREEPSAGPSPFREVWNMTKPKSGGSGWLVAGLQAMQ